MPAASPSDTSVSAIVAVYNGERFIADALASILAQTTPPDEVVVVDDGSTDGTGAVVARFPGVRCLRRDANGGQASALNWAVASTRGAYLAFRPTRTTSGRRTSSRASAPPSPKTPRST